MKGRCTICDSIGSLTSDHVPPRSVCPPTPIELRRLTPVLQGGDATDRPRAGFQAAKFPSLCRACNTDRLGNKYDPILAKLAEDVRRWLTVTTDLDIWIAGDIQATTAPLRLARSVAGHLLAAEERKNRSTGPARGTLTEALRKFFLDDDALWPEDLHLYIWLYPTSNQVIVRGFGISQVLGSTYGPIIGDVLKFFPLAFWITAAPASGVRYRLTKYLSSEVP